MTGLVTFTCPVCKNTTRQDARLDGQVACNSKAHLPRRIVPMQRSKP